MVCTWKIHLLVQLLKYMSLDIMYVERMLSYWVVNKILALMEYLLLQINKIMITKAKLQPSLMEIKLKVNIGKISN